tara:strand:+ start:303 stop:680 length:378 start_codon:yes stop_codon:yes gene_type:complete
MINWKQTAQDTLALGSIAFYILVVGRALIEPFTEFVTQLIIAAVILFALSLKFKAELHIARATILAVFTILFYNSTNFTIFAAAVYAIILYSTKYLKIRQKLTLNGFTLGLISSVGSYHLTRLVL